VGTEEPRERLPDGTPLFVRDSEGSQHPIAVTANTIRLDDREYAHVVVRNISERRERERRAEAILDQTHQFTGLLAPDGTLLEANRTALEFGGLDRDEILGEPFAEAGWWPDAEKDRLRDAIDRAAEGEFVRYEAAVTGPTGEIVIDFSLRPVTDDAGEVELLIPEGRDISERVRRERQLDVLARLLRHNFRNDMTVVQGYAEMLTERLSGESADLAEGLSESVGRLLDLTETYRETVELVSDPPEPVAVELNAALRNALDRVRDDHPDAAVGIDCPPDVSIRAIPRVGRAVEELVANALVHHDGDARVTVSAQRTDGDVVVRVVDDGPGIPAAEANILRGDQSVEPLEHGTGMGLWLVYWLVTLSDGTITVDCPEEGGSVVEMRFRAA
jgi:PAS domain S-box-containing protein